MLRAAMAIVSMSLTVRRILAGTHDSGDDARYLASILQGYCPVMLQQQYPRRNVAQTDGQLCYQPLTRWNANGEHRPSLMKINAICEGRRNVEREGYHVSRRFYAIMLKP